MSLEPRRRLSSALRSATLALCSALAAGSVLAAGWVGVGGALREDTRSIAFGRTGAQTIYAFSGHKHYGVFRAYSTTNGAAWGTWQQTGLNEFMLYDPATENVAQVNVVVTGNNYASTHLVLAGTSGGKIFRSTDDGANWTLATGLPGGAVMEMAVSPNGHILATVYGYGIYRSMNGGSSFTQLAGPIGTGRFMDLELDPTYPTSGAFYSCTEADETNGGAIYRWGGSAWQDISGGFPTLPSGEKYSFATVAVAPTGNYVWAGDTAKHGLFGTSNGGVTWNQGCLSCDQIFELRTAPDFTDVNRHLMVGTAAGWHESVAGVCAPRKPTGLAITSIVFDPNWSTANPILWLATSDGIRRFGAHEFPAPPDSGAEFSLFDISVFAPSPSLSADNTVYAASQRFGVFISRDAGQSYTQFMPPLENATNPSGSDSNVTALALHPYFGQGTLCGGNTSTVFMATDGAGVYRSEAAGTTWVAMNNGLGNLRVPILLHTYLIPVDANYPLWAALKNSPQIYRYTPATDFWNPTDNPPPGSRVTALGLPPNHDGSAGKAEVYAATDLGLYRSQNRGDTWQPEAFPDPPPVGGYGEILAIAFHPGYNGDTVQQAFCLRKGQGIYKRIFDTQSAAWKWVPINSGLTNLNLEALAVSPTYGTDLSLAVGVRDLSVQGTSSVFATTNGGANWFPRSGGMALPQVKALAYIFTAGHLRLLAGTLKQRAFFNEEPNNSTGSNWIPATGFESTQGEIRTVVMSPAPTNTGCAPLLPDAEGSDVFLGGTRGVFWSNDGGETFRPINEGLAGVDSCVPEVSALFVFRNPEHLTTTWVARAGGVEAGTPEPTPMLLAGTKGQGVWYRYALKDPSSGAFDWAKGVWVQSELNNLDITKFTRERNLASLVVRAATPVGAFTSRELAAGVMGENWFYSGLGESMTDIRNANTPGGTLKLPDEPNAPSGGATWGTVSLTGVRKGTEVGGFAEAPDAITWSTRNGSGAGTLADLDCLSVIQLTGGTVLTGTKTTGVYRTDDEGVDFWETSSAGLESTSQNIQDFLESSNGDVLCAVKGTTNGGVFLSADQGRHWVSLSTGFSPTGQTLASIVADSGNPPTYYAGTYSSGSYASTVSPLTPPAVTALDVTTGPSTGGTTVTVTGTNFLCACPSGYSCTGGTQAVASFGGVDGTTTSCSATSLTVTTPNHPAGSAPVDVAVRNPDTRTGTLAGAFTFTDGSSVTLTVSRNGSNQVQVSWTGSGTPQKVYRSTSPDFSTVLVTKLAGSSPYTFADASGTDSHTYYYTVE